MKVGDVIEILKHRLKVKEIYKCKSPSGFNLDRVFLNCRPECCNGPYGLMIDCSLGDAETLGKVWSFAVPKEK